MATKQHASVLSKGTIVLFAVAILLLLVSGVGSARAALTYFSETYTAQVELPDIGVTLQENGVDVSHRDYSGADDKWNTGVDGTDVPNGTFKHDFALTGGKVMPGRAYSETITVKNSGTIDEYVRVKVHKYWLDADGNKTTVLSPDLIGIKYMTDNGWVENPDERTTEMQTFYFSSMLAPQEVTPSLTESITIDPEIVKDFETVEETTDDGYTVITRKYMYNGYRFIVEAEVDAVQTHNAEQAIKSAWSVDVTVDEADGSMALA